jgi:hypothetical protein
MFRYNSQTDSVDCDTTSAGGKSRGNFAATPTKGRAIFHHAHAPNLLINTSLELDYCLGLCKLRSNDIVSTSDAWVKRFIHSTKLALLYVARLFSTRTAPDPVVGRHVESIL